MYVRSMRRFKVSMCEIQRRYQSFHILTVWYRSLYVCIRLFLREAIERHKSMELQSAENGFHHTQQLLPQDSPFHEVSISLHSLMLALTVYVGEDCFEKADTFIPERWYEKPDMIYNRAAHAPFGTGKIRHPYVLVRSLYFVDTIIGAHSCLGQYLALDKMRLVIAVIVKKYTFRIASGETGDCLRHDLRDQFTSNPGQLRLMFELREKKQVW